MPVTKVELRLPRDNGLPEDTVVQTFHFQHELPVLSNLNIDDLVTAFIRFYSVDTTSGGSMGTYFANYLNAGSWELRAYLIGALPNTPPYATRSFSAARVPLSGQDLPGEVSVVLSIQGTPGNVQPQARRRGRLYLPPMNVTALGATVQFVVPVAPALRTNISEAAQRFQDDTVAIINGTAPVLWGVWSRGQGTKDEGSTTPTSTFDWTPFFTAYTNGWVDNAFDTQRRRGSKATARTTFSLI